MRVANRLTVGALEVEYDEVGAGERPLVLLHGFAGSRDDFADVLGNLGAHGRTLVPDQRGHGGTTNPGEGYTLEQLTADLAHFLDAVGAERCDLLGHSLGGMVALRLALSQPERVASLVLMDTAARSVTPAPRFVLRAVCQIARRVPPSWLWRMTRAGRRRLPEPMRRAEQEMGPERYWERLRIKLEAMDPIAYDELVRAIFDQPSLGQRLCEIRCTTLVLVGECDEAFHVPSRELADGIPDAELVVIEGAHHSAQIETRDAWLEVIRAHLERVRG
jgi:pimeloyl-ACP methyl ester carboxylesterase